jgi:hypothetical protein
MKTMFVARHHAIPAEPDAVPSQDTARIGLQTALIGIGMLTEIEQSRLPDTASERYTCELQVIAPDRSGHLY